MVDLKPIDSGDLESCPSGLGDKLKQIIPLIEEELRKADGDNPYVVYKFEDLTKAMNSGATKPHGFAACLNRILEEQFKDKTRIKAHGQRDDIRFDFIKPSEMKRVYKD